MDDLLERLTAAQCQAVTHVEGPLLILAGPGSGKTRVVTHRIVYLVRQSVPARQILALTFTNKAADEMRQRVEQLAPGQPVWLGTFHRFCARLLRQQAALVGLAENFSIYDREDSRKVLAEAIAESDVELTHITPEQIAQEIGRAKTNLMTASDYTPRPGNFLGTVVQKIYPRYQRQLLTANAVDFDDMLLHVATLLKDNPELRRGLDSQYRYILVDEYQDTNFAQYAIVRSLCRDHPNLAVTGDPDQSIYGWRGASLKNILDFERDFPNVAVVRLEQNYRSTKNILRVADQLIAYNTRRKQKSLFTDNSVGKPVRLVTYPSGRDEAEDIAARIADDLAHNRYRARDCAIFYRVNSLSRLFENALRTANVPYQIVRGLEFYQRKEVKDVLAYLHLINNPRSDVALRRIINTPPRSIGSRTIERLTDHARERQLSLLEAARESGLVDALNKRSATHVAQFVAMFDRLSLLAAAPLEEIIGRVLSETGYNEWLEDSGKPEDDERLANVKELLTDGREFDMEHPGGGELEEFLERTSLVSDTDDWELESDRVSLMTLHAAKGLEFRVVYVVAVEEGFLPHQRSRENQEQLEEERRLLFVGITRAQDELQLSSAQRRLIQGSSRFMISSSFLLELPRDEMDVYGPRTRSSPAPDADYEVYAPEDWDDSDAKDDAFAHEEPVWQHESMAEPERPAPDAQPESARMMTAAELLGNQAGKDTGAPSTTRFPPEAFQRGMVVRHPERGLGKIIALSGEGDKRSATVQFFAARRPHTYYLVYCKLEPVKSGAD